MRHNQCPRLHAFPILVRHINRFSLFPFPFPATYYSLPSFRKIKSFRLPLQPPTGPTMASKSCPQRTSGRSSPCSSRRRRRRSCRPTPPRSGGPTPCSTGQPGESPGHFFLGLQYFYFVIVGKNAMGSDLSIIAVLTFDKSMKQIFFMQLVWLVPSLSLVLFCVIVKGGNPGKSNRNKDTSTYFLIAVWSR